MHRSQCTAAAKKRAFGRISSAHLRSKASAFETLICHSFHTLLNPAEVSKRQKTLKKWMTNVWFTPKRQRSLIVWLWGSEMVLKTQRLLQKHFVIKCKREMRAFGHFSASSVLAYKDYFLIDTLTQITNHKISKSGQREATWLRTNRSTNQH